MSVVDAEGTPTKGRSLSVDVATNVGFAIVSTLAVVWLTRLSTSRLSPLALALFLSVRRYSATISALANLGGPLFQIRYMGMHARDERLADLVALFVTLVALVVGSLLFLGVIVGRPVLEQLFSASHGYPSWFIWLLVIMAIEQLLVFSVQAYWLVKRQIVLYNIYKFTTATGLFIPIFLFETYSTPEGVLTKYLIAGGALILLGLAATTMKSLWRGPRLPWERLKWVATEARSYGPPRALVNFLDGLLFVLSPWLVRNDVTEAGFVLTMFIFVQATAVVILPVNELAMVVSANHVGAGDDRPLTAVASRLFELLLVFSALLVAVAVPFRHALLRLAIGNATVLAGVTGYSALLTCIVPVTLFSGLKGIIEIRWRRPLNLVSLGLSLGTLVACYYSLRSLGWTTHSAVLVATLAGFWAVGIATLCVGRSLFVAVDRKRLLSGIALVVGGAGANALLAWLLSDQRLGFQLAVATTSALVTAIVALRIMVAAEWARLTTRFGSFIRSRG